MFWMELRCADEAEPHAYNHQFDRCWSHDNHGAGMHADLTLESVNRTRKAVIKSAKGAGWKVIRGHGIICPFCAEQRRKTT